MSLLRYQMNQYDTACQGIAPAPLGIAPYVNEFEERSKRDPATDLKNGIDIVFELKKKIDKLHPIATETIIRLLSM